MNGIPGGSTDFIFNIKDPAGIIAAVDRHGHEPGDHHPDADRAGTYTFEVLGFQGDLGDFTFTIQRRRPRGPINAVVLTAKAWGHEGGDQVTRRVPQPGRRATRR